jgi:hypothetical protein
MAKVCPVKNQAQKLIGYSFICPGCKNRHVFYTDYPEYPEKNWQFNGDVDKPTFSPSLLILGDDNFNKRCHSFVKEGKIQFLSDCEHSLAGQTIELPEVGT